MRVSVGQIYIKAGVGFPFSVGMQRWLGGELSDLASDATAFAGRYGGDFSLMIRVSAETGIFENQIKGPTVFKKDKDVEYTVFLPYQAIMVGAESRRLAAQFLIDGVREVFRQAGIDTEKLDACVENLVDQLSSGEGMVNKPWPSS